MFNRCKDVIEENQLDPYPFKYFKLIEAPSSFLRETPFSDNIQPEIAFFEERFATTTHYKPGVLLEALPRDMSMQEYVLYNNLPYYLEQIHVDYIFTGHSHSITSDRYQGMDVIFKKMLNPEGLRSWNIMLKMLEYIAERGLKGIIMEEYSMEQEIAISLKASHLLGYLTTITTWDSLTRFMQEFNVCARFREVNFDSFIDEFEQRFGQNIETYMDEWYISHEMPRLTIKDLSRKVTEET